MNGIMENKVRARRGFSITGIEATLAMALEKRFAAGNSDYLAACEADYANGFRASHCEHGTSQWTDYDNICGGCEEGITMGDGIQRRRRALNEARERIEKANMLMTVAHMMKRGQVEFDVKPYYAMIEACMDVNRAY